MSATAQATLEIRRAESAGEYTLRLTFQDGKEVTVDFGPFLHQAQHSEIRQYLDPVKFQTYRLDHGDLMWGDYDLCFPIADLYEGHVT